MSLISASIPNLINGVSQQPYVLRLASQAEDQENAYSSAITGLSKRPPTRHIAQVTGDRLDACKVHVINRDATERYVTFIGNGGMRVFELNGKERTVFYPQGNAYLASANPAEDFACLTVADYTFVLNKRVPVMGGGLVPRRPFEALIWIKQGAYACNYGVNIGGRQVFMGTVDSSQTINQQFIQTGYIAQRIYEALTGDPGAGGNGVVSYSGNRRGDITVQLIGSIIYCQSNTDFVMTTTDSIGDMGISGLKGQVQRFTDLPARAVPGMVLKVAGAASEAADDYYVQYKAEATNPYGGVWKECAKPGEPNELAASTMPHVLKRKSNGDFSFEEAGWLARTVGDMDTVPYPSFLNRTLNDVFFHRNRLGFLADENVIFSGAGDFFNFFRTSAIQVLDGDMIDIAATSTKVSILRHAVPFNELLVIFSDQTQFQLSANGALTAKTVAMAVTTEYDCSPKVKPVTAGQNIFFAVNRGAYSAIQEYAVDLDTKTAEAADITGHVPMYLPANLSVLASTPNEKALVAISPAQPHVLYLYQYLWQDRQKVQSAWTKWTFPTNDSILGAAILESDLYLIVTRGDGTFIDVVSLEPGRTDAPLPFTVRLDRRLSQAQVTNVVYNSATDETAFDVPYGLEGDAYQLVSTEPVGALRTVPIRFTPGYNRVTAKGRLGRFLFGRRYAFRHTFSPFLVREGDDGKSPIMTGRLQVRNVAVTYADTGYFRAEVTPLARDTYTYVFSGRKLGSARNVVGQPAVEDGAFRIPVMSKNDQVQITLVNDSPLPCGFLHAEWEGFFNMRSKRY